VHDGAVRNPTASWRTLLEPVPAASPADLHRWIVGRGEGWIVVDKPAGVLAQPDGSDAPDLVTLARRALGEASIGALHRIDRNVSGLVLLAWGKAAAPLHAELQAGRVTRRYRAIVRGAPADRAFVVDADLRKDERTNQVTSRARGGAGAPRGTDGEGWETAETRVELVETRTASFGPVSDLAIELVTGRSHQIRAHLAFVGLLLVGDPKYGAPASVLPPRSEPVGTRAVPLRRPLLHAARLAFLERAIESRPPWDADLLARLTKPRR
jgi:23S rRNA pseudouridine955/2504/2580 synthase